ncbi:hypothetical protein [Leptospira borgpetersenii]|uniref:Uncharacterized protein n=1 Tax=Leptospira borgpetersenii str. Brem 328 TaxID=1049780 RepID=A0ABC9SJS4_LEPBO|nr:hypothetical protein [Leptospira borgpetersenii]EMN15158.1 hypothetical protein LEP1GSC055_0417 [Leptospira borgpetersenii str. Brem 307]EMN18058.1 hypothetical protein LEP1GSC056_0474 [Leptospira borgpetersenii str. Brem 328]
MIRTNEYEKIRKQTLKELDAMLESGGEGLAVWHLMYIQDKPEPKYYPLEVGVGNVTTLPQGESLFNDRCLQ